MTQTSSPADPGTGLGVVRAQRIEALSDELARRLATPVGDPFVLDLVVGPGAGMQRWLSQRLAAAGGAGICAGIEFVDFAGLDRRVTGNTPDPWRPDRAVWALHQLVTGSASADPGLNRLHDHLGSSREPVSALSRIARRFADYAEWRPGMLNDWRAGHSVDDRGTPLGADAWQAHLWRLLREHLGGVDPVESHRLGCAELTAHPAKHVPPRVAVFAPFRLSPRRLDILTALGRHHQVELMLISSSPTSWSGPGQPLGPRREARVARVAGSGHPLNEHLGRHDRELAAVVGQVASPGALVISEDPPDTLLGWLQADLAGDRAPAARRLRGDDRSLRIHRSHGLDRQVEVLRDAVTELMSLDPSLEPRDIVVLCPDVDEVAPLVSAAFGLAPGRAGSHPGHQLRVQLADRTTAQVNPLVSVLQQVLGLADARLEASALLDFCAEPAVARRFGFGPDDHERLSELANKAAIRWGLNPAHRGRFGLAEIGQNTWTAGVQRLLLGVALSEQDLATAKTALPVDDVESSDVERLGGLAELLGRLGRLITQFEAPAPLSVWLGRCRGALGQLVALPSQDEWQLGDLWAGLARIEERCPVASGAPLSLAAIRRVVEQEFATHPARAAFGNGSMIVCGLSSLRRVPHRVVCLLGWDAGRYPRLPPRHGDDLLAADPWVGDPHPGISERQALLDAVHAARDHLVIVYRGRSEATNEVVPPPAPLAELFAALDRTCGTRDGVPGARAVTIDHALQPFDARYYDGALPRSFDPVGLAGARARLGPREPVPSRYHLEPLPPLDLTEGVGVDDLVSFFAHPLRHLLRVRAGLRLGRDEEEADEIPIELDGLARWSIGTRTLSLARSGFDAGRVTRAERLRGDLPPAELGRRAMDQILRDVDRVLNHLPPEAGSAKRVMDVSAPLSIPVRGRIVVHDHTIVATEFSRLAAKHRLTAWLRLLTLASAEPGPWRAVTATPSRTGVWRAPEPEAARAMLEFLVAVYEQGLRRPLPLAPRLCAEYASLRSGGLDPDDPRFEGLLARAWHQEIAHDEYWPLFFAFPAVLQIGRDADDWLGHPEERHLMGALARGVWDPLRAHEEAR